MTSGSAKMMEETGHLRADSYPTFSVSRGQKAQKAGLRFALPSMQI